MPDKALLTVDEVEVRYGALVAVRRVSFTVARGEVLAVLGPNGAGKSSLLRAISGLTRVAHGRVVYDGEDITRVSAARCARRGIAHVLEGRGIFADLNVVDNLRVGGAGLSDNALTAALERIFGLFPRLHERARQMAGSLSGGEQQQLAIGRALIREPALLLLDEMSLGLAPQVVTGLFETLHRIREAGTTVILVEQFVSQAMAVADNVVVLEKGSVVRMGAAASNTQLDESYVPLPSRAQVHAGATEAISLDIPTAVLRRLESEALRGGTTVAALLEDAVSERLLESGHETG